MRTGWDSSVFLRSCREQQKKFSQNGSKTFQKRVTMMPGRWPDLAVPFKDSWDNSHQPQQDAALIATCNTGSTASSYVPVMKTGGGFWNCMETNIMRQNVSLYVQLRNLAILNSDEYTCCRKVRKGPAAKLACLACSTLGADFVWAHKPRKAYNQWTKNLKPQKPCGQDAKYEVLCQYNYLSRNRF